MKTGSRWILVVVLGAAPLAWGAGPPPSSTVAPGKSPYAIRDPKVDPKLTPAARARAQRAADIKRRNDLKKATEQQEIAKNSAAGQSGPKGGAK